MAVYDLGQLEVRMFTYKRYSGMTLVLVARECVLQGLPSK
jgi:hypothetical protein